MGERNWYGRYRDAKEYADSQAAAYERGDEISGWRQVSETDTRRETLQGAAWISWCYEIAASDARTLVQVRGKHWQILVDQCARLAREYSEKASKQA